MSWDCFNILNFWFNIVRRILKLGVYRLDVSLVDYLLAFLDGDSLLLKLLIAIRG